MLPSNTGAFPVIMVFTAPYPSSRLKNSLPQSSPLSLYTPTNQLPVHSTSLNMCPSSPILLESNAKLNSNVCALPVQLTLKYSALPLKYGSYFTSSITYSEVSCRLCTFLIPPYSFIFMMFFGIPKQLNNDDNEASVPLVL